MNDPETQTIKSTLKFISMKCNNEMRISTINWMTINCKQSRTPPMILQPLNEYCIDKKTNSPTAECLWQEIFNTSHQKYN